LGIRYFGEGANQVGFLAKSPAKRAMNHKFTAPLGTKSVSKKA
jgi:hypothetical protein